MKIIRMVVLAGLMMGGVVSHSFGMELEGAYDAITGEFRESEEPYDATLAEELLTKIVEYFTQTKMVEYCKLGGADVERVSGVFARSLARLCYNGKFYIIDNTDYVDDFDSLPLYNDLYVDLGSLPESFDVDEYHDKYAGAEIDFLMNVFLPQYGKYIEFVQIDAEYYHEVDNILKYTPNLTELNLYGAKVVEVPRRTIESLKNLEIINLSCNQTLEKLPHWLALMPRLKEIHLDDCVQITREEIKDFVEQFPYIEVMHDFDDLVQ